MSGNQRKSSSSSSSSSSDNQDIQPKIMTSAYPQQTIQTFQPAAIPQQVTYQQTVPQQQIAYSQIQGQAFSSLPAGVTEEQVRRSLAGVSLDVIKGEVRQEYIPMTRVETEYKEEVQYEQVPRQVKVTDYYQVEIQEERIPQVYQHTYTEYVPQQKIIPIVQYKAMEKTYTRPEIMSGDVRVEQGQAEIISSQIIATESNAQATVPLPQVQASGVTITQQPQQFVTSQQFKMKKKSSSSSAGKQVIYQQPAQFQQVSAYPQVATASIKQAPMQIQTQTLPPVQTVQRSVTYATQAPVQAVPMQMGIQQRVVQQGIVPGPQIQQGYVQQGLQPAIQTSNFQGVRLADSHILMK